MVRTLVPLGKLHRQAVAPGEKLSKLVLGKWKVATRARWGLASGIVHPTDFVHDAPEAAEVRKRLSHVPREERDVRRPQAGGCRRPVGGRVGAVWLRLGYWHLRRMLRAL